MPLNLSHIQDKTVRNFNALKQRAQPNLRVLLDVLAPGGRIRGHKYFALNPTRADASIGSFHFDLHTEQFKDWADTGSDGGRGIIDFAMYVTGLSHNDAYDLIENMLGGVSVTCPQKIAVRTKIMPDWVSIPFPSGTPNTNLGKLKPSNTWIYRDANGDIILYVCRYQPNGEKFYLPWAFWKQTHGSFTIQSWRHFMPPNFNTIYNLDRVVTSTGLIVICEGEKAADAAERLIPECVATTSRNGAGAAGKADWSPLFGRNVLLWPDNDPNGFHYANTVQTILPQAKILDLTQFGNIFQGWDAADCFAANMKVII